MRNMILVCRANVSKAVKFTALIFNFMLRFPFQLVINWNSVRIYSYPTVTTVRKISYSVNKMSFSGYEQPETKQGAYETASESIIQMPCIILVNPFLEQNVGSVARTMLNFGLTELRVVEPRCDILSDGARALAVGSHQILEQAKIYATLQECISDLNIVMATTIRPRHMTQMIYTPKMAANLALSVLNDKKCGILFGRERSGLTNDEVAFADGIVTIPTFKQFSSLNLAQAVNIVGYELFSRKLELENSSPPDTWLQPKDGEGLATRDDVNNFLTRLESKLDVRYYQTNPGKRAICYRNVRNIFQRVLLGKSEVDLMQGVLTALIKEVNIASDEEEKLTAEDLLVSNNEIKTERVE